MVTCFLSTKIYSGRECNNADFNRFMAVGMVQKTSNNGAKICRQKIILSQLILS